MATATAPKAKAKIAAPKVAEQKLFIGGKLASSASGKTFETLNPATGEVICNVAEGDKADIDAAVKASHLPAQDTQLAATALLGALHEALVGPLAPDNLDDHARMRDAVQSVTLLALRAVGVMDARARGLVVQAVLPAKAALVGA